MTPEQLNEIERIAKAATPGPWYVHTSIVFGDKIHNTRIATPQSPNGNYPVDAFPHNAAYIARLDPATTLAMVARIRELEEAMKPFAEAANAETRYEIIHHPNDKACVLTGDSYFPSGVKRATYGDLRRAAAVLRGEKKTDGDN